MFMYYPPQWRRSKLVAATSELKRFGDEKEGPLLAGEVERAASWASVKEEERHEHVASRKIIWRD